MKKFKLLKWICRGSYTTTCSAHLCTNCIKLLLSECFVEQPRSHVSLRKHTKIHHIHTTQYALSRLSITCACSCCGANHRRCDCSHEIKRCLLLGRKPMTNLDRLLKSRDITLLTKVHLVKAMVFPVVMCGCETWTIKLTAEESMLSNCVLGEDSWESLGLQGNPTSPS